MEEWCPVDMALVLHSVFAKAVPEKWQHNRHYRYNN